MNLTEKQKKFLDLFIDPDETFCVSHNPYGYHSISREELNSNEFTLTPPEPTPEQVEKGLYLKPESITANMINMLAINPISGWRDDKSCTAFRSFLIEVDDGPLKEQMKYIDSYGLPYSCCVFSGGKSLHFGIVLDVPLPSITAYRMVSRWILSILKKADQQTINPSRGIRFPGNLRRVYGKKVVNASERKEQKLLILKGRISQKELFNWLNKYKEHKPVVRTRKKTMASKPSLKNLSVWAKKEIKAGVPANDGRNKTWFALGYDFCLAGYELDDTYDILESYFTEEHDFIRREWEYTINRGFNKCIEEN